MNIDYEIELESVLDAMFPDTVERGRVIAKLNRYGTESYQREAPRVRLSILRLTFNQPEKLDYYIAEACKDYRDILSWAEYPETSKTWGLNRSNPEKYKRLRAKEEHEFLSWLTSLRQT